MNRSLFGLGVTILVVATLAGCREDCAYPLTSEILTLTTNKWDGVVDKDTGRHLSDLSPESILVDVDGATLTKQAYEDLRLFRVETLKKRRNLSMGAIDKMLEQYSQNIIPHFVLQQLLLKDALSDGTVTQEEIISHVSNVLRETAKRQNKTIKSLLAAYSGRERYYLYEIAIAYATTKLVAKKIPPIQEVTPEFVKLVHDQVAAENAAATATNNLHKSKLVGLREKALSGADLVAAGKQMTGVSAPIVAGILENCEQVEIDDPEIASKVFSLKENALSEVFEDENCLMLFKVLKINPARRDEEERLVSKESRRLARVSIEKLPLMVVEGDIELTKDLKHQMQLQAVDRYVTMLSTNGEHVISYPYGKNIR